MSYQRAPAQTGMGRRPKRSFRLAGQSWMHRATDSPEMEQSGIEGVTGGRCGAVRVKQQTLVLTAAGFDNEPTSGGDALRGNTRSHPEHDG